MTIFMKGRRKMAKIGLGPNQTNNEKGAMFESQVKLVLESLGYKVVHNSIMSGNQIDIYAEYSTPLDTIRSIVECKCESERISIDVIRKFYSTVDSVSTKSKRISGMIVSETGYSKDAKLLAIKLGISLFTLDDLKSRVFDAFAIAESTTSAFEASFLGSCYVDLSCQVHEDGRGTIYKPVEKFLESFFEASKKSGVAILGNFGTGKTCLCKHYAYLLSKNWINEPSKSYLPIYVNLRDVRDFSKLPTTLVNSIESEYSIYVSEMGITQWLKQGRTLLLLDGFDEMAAKMDRPEINHQLIMLMQFIAKNKVKVILTCRTHFFKTQVDENTLGDMLRLYILSWGVREVEDYMQKSLPHKHDIAINTIRDTYNLEELSKTPIFLSMISATVGDIEGAVNQTKLYELYTNMWIDNQNYRSSIDTEDKRKLMHDLAFEMYSGTSQKLDYIELPDKVKVYLGVKNYELIQQFDKEIRTCTFLVRNAEGKYHFCHRSFMEFFVARRLAEAIKIGNSSDFEKIRISREIAGFFANYFDEDWSILLPLLISGKSTFARLNTALAISNLPRNQTLLRALQTAFELEKDFDVRCAVVDALCQHEDLDLVISASKEHSSIGIYCIKALGPHSGKEQVHYLYKSVLESIDEEPDIVAAVLNSLGQNGDQTYIPPIMTFLRIKWWHGRSIIVDELISAVVQVADVNMAKAFGRLEDKLVIPKECTLRYDHAIRELGIRVIPDIEKFVIEKKAEGYNYQQAEGASRSEFKRLVLDNKDSLKSILTKVYGSSSLNKVKKRGKSVPLDQIEGV